MEATWLDLKRFVSLDDYDMGSPQYRKLFSAAVNVMLLLSGIRSVYFEDSYEPKMKEFLAPLIAFSRDHGIRVKVLPDDTIVFTGPTVRLVAGDRHPTSYELNYLCHGEHMEVPQYGNRERIDVEFLADGIPLFNFLCLELDLPKLNKLCKFANRIDKFCRSVGISFELSVVNERRWLLE
ncbi:MAG: hypothetical protein ACYCOU_22485 [Sulfobacillus sp.]